MITTAWPSHPQGLREHLLMGHGVWVEDEKTRAGLVEAHRYCHTEREIGTPIPHTHPGLPVAHGRPREQRPVPTAGGVS